jgi:type II secretory pathway component GspD/PulD (secretin)
VRQTKQTLHALASAALGLSLVAGAVVAPVVNAEAAPKQRRSSSRVRVTSRRSAPAAAKATTPKTRVATATAGPDGAKVVLTRSAAAPKPAEAAAPAKVLAPTVPVAPATTVGVAAKQPGAYPALLAPAATGARQTGTAAAAATMEDLADRRVSLDFVAADINDVLKALSLQSGINIVTGADVKGNITVSLKRVSLPEAMDMVTRLSGFQYSKYGSAYVVGTPASVSAITGGVKAAEIPVTGFIRYRYTPPAQMYRVLQEKFPGIRLPEADKDQTGAAASPAFAKLLVLTDSKERVDAVSAFVEQMEQAVQVPTISTNTEFYRIKYANPNDLITILSRLVPTVAIQLGPSQVFQGASGAGSATFSSGGTFGPAAGGGGAAGGGAAAPAAGGANLGAGGSGGVANGIAASGSTILLISGAPADIARARQVLEQIDIKTPQITYEARVVDINRDDLQRLGLTYDVTRPVNIGEKNEQGLNTVGPTAGATPGGNVNFGAIFRSPYTVGVQLNALANINRARTLANPNLSALDGQPATAFIGDQVKYVVAVQQTQQGQTIQTETATVGITLKVTGKASPDGTITLYIHPEVSSITSFLSPGNGVSLPQISTRFVDTTIRVKDGETIAIGGLIREQDIKNLQKLPILGDIPLLGQLFRFSDRQKRRSELVVFVTARTAKD